LSRIPQAFARLKRDHGRGFIPFITAGDPDLPTTRDLIIELAHCGATLIELGIPFTDPMADGTVIQRASERALRHGFGIGEVLQLVSEARKETNVPIILFSYFNPLLQFALSRKEPFSPGPFGQSVRLEAFDPVSQDSVPESVRTALGFSKLALKAKYAGVDGILVTDLAPEEAGEFAAALRAQDLDLIFLVAPTSTDQRLKLVADQASGFIYAVSRAGITGAREEMSAEAEKLVRRLRRFSDLPVAVGFGISNAAHVKDVLRYADAAVVGSAIVREIEQSGSSTDAINRVSRFAQSLISD